MIEARERMLIEPAPAPGVREKLVIEAPKPVGLITQGSADDAEEKEEDGKTGDKEKIKEEDEDRKEKGRELSLISKPLDGEETKEVVDVMAKKKDTRPAGVDGWKFKVCFSH